MVLLELGGEMLEKLIAGFLPFFFNGLGGVTTYRLLGVPFHTTLAFVTLYWSGTLLLTYYGTGWIAERTTKWESINSLIKILKKWWRKVIRTLKFRKRLIERGVFWLINQKKWVTLALSFIPYVPQLPTITIIAARLMKIRYALPILLLGNAFRTFILIATIYQLFPALWA